jgi:hypothetical protein
MPIWLSGIVWLLPVLSLCGALFVAAWDKGNQQTIKRFSLASHAILAAGWLLAALGWARLADMSEASLVIARVSFLQDLPLTLAWRVDAEIIAFGLICALLSLLLHLAFHYQTKALAPSPWPLASLGITLSLLMARDYGMLWVSWAALSAVGAMASRERRHGPGVLLAGALSEGALAWSMANMWLSCRTWDLAAVDLCARSELTTGGAEASRIAWGLGLSVAARLAQMAFLRLTPSGESVSTSFLEASLPSWALALLYLPLRASSIMAMAPAAQRGLHIMSFLLALAWVCWGAGDGAVGRTRLPNKASSALQNAGQRILTVVTRTRDAWSAGWVAMLCLCLIVLTLLWAR